MLTSAPANAIPLTWTSIPIATDEQIPKHEHVPGMQKNRQLDTIPERGYARPETTLGVTFNTDDSDNDHLCWRKS